MWNSAVIISLLCGLVIPGAESLKCYRCLALDCPEEPLFCNQVREFVMSQLPELYYVDHNLPQCPKPKDEEEAWLIMQKTYPSSFACGAIQENEATCVLGRFQVVSNHPPADVNVTSHGTVMGCARRKLLENTVIQFNYRDPKVKNSTERQVTINKCHITKTQRNPHDGYSIRHFMELEHCSKYTDMCYDREFCVLPQMSAILPFQDQSYGPSIPMMIIIIFAIILGVMVCGLTFLGFKYV